MKLLIRATSSCRLLSYHYRRPVLHLACTRQARAFASYSSSLAEFLSSPLARYEESSLERRTALGREIVKVVDEETMNEVMEIFLHEKGDVKGIINLRECLEEYAETLHSQHKERENNAAETSSASASTESRAEHEAHDAMQRWLSVSGQYLRDFLKDSVSVRRLIWNDLTEPTVSAMVRGSAQVHAMQSNDGARRRITGAHKRCFGVFHESMETPLAFVECALLNDLASRIEPLLDDDKYKLKKSAVRSSSHAIFYSIVNTFAGVKGAALGKPLLEGAQKLLSDEFDHALVFATLSPIPHFRRWLHSRKKQLLPPFMSLRYLRAHSPLAPHDVPLLNTFFELYKYELLSSAREYFRLTRPSDATSPLVEHQSMQEVTEACKRDSDALFGRPRRVPFDPVARFHLGNGARLGPIHYQADRRYDSVRFDESFGMMVSYIYSTEAVVDEVAKRGEKEKVVRK